MTITVKKIGGSAAVVIPKGIAKQMQLEEGASLEISSTGDAIVMRRPTRRARRPFQEMVAEIKPANYRRRRMELGQDGPVGKEIW
jgi:antitoxin component of MazEF toxin-antitoxin module